MSFILGYFEHNLIKEFYQNSKKLYFGFILDRFCFILGKLCQRFSSRNRCLQLLLQGFKDLRKLAVNSWLTACEFFNGDLRPKFLLGPNYIILFFLGIF